ncbi:MAG: hypothetical protein B7Y89_07625 [Novosphingobium sp. 32-60-15]|uniref:hypothetical protein n=1 Tax=unclassified Novosphingobium TaxID=2644732 RepID=UPI000BDC7011|nr:MULTISPECIES: hypothetical protein [unclassified Novosphingobium]OYX62748.1 MAG: hypothetical protein B7Y89_07625 [Novosphingobium sp. 32-60-15]
MRADVKTLFDRLGKTDFQYRDFGDRFTEAEAWPVFEAILRDPRVQQTVIGNVVVPAREPEPEVRVQSPAAQNALPLGAALSRKYGGQPPHTNARTETHEPQDVRSLLARISTAVSKGTI